MKILAMDTSAVTASVALFQDEQLVAVSELRTRMTHSQTILPMTEDLLKNAHWQIDDIDMFAVNVGPGSFTGVRIGVAAVKGLAFSSDAACVPVSTLQSMAYNFKGLYDSAVICAVMDARCNQVYTATFKVEGDTVSCMTDDAALSIDTLGTQLSDLQQPIILVGDGAKICYDQLKETVPDLRCAPDLLRYQSAVGVAAAALSAAEKCTAAELQPRYLRLPQAERELKARLEKQ